MEITSLFGAYSGPAKDHFVVQQHFDVDSHFHITRCCTSSKKHLKNFDWHCLHGKKAPPLTAATLNLSNEQVLGTDFRTQRTASAVNLSCL